MENIYQCKRELISESARSGESIKNMVSKFKITEIKLILFLKKELCRITNTKDTKDIKDTDIEDYFTALLHTDIALNSTINDFSGKKIRSNNL